MRYVLVLVLILQSVSWAGKQCDPLLSPATVAEETVATCLSPNNGAGPLWCYGSPLLFRDEEEVYASVMEASPDVEPLCNTRWRLFVRRGSGWELVRAAEGFRIREPSPLVGFPGGPVFLSITPSTQPPGTKYGPCVTRLLVFDPKNLSAPPEEESPKWEGDPYFTDHSYRGVAADGSRREILWLNIDAKTSVQHWSFRNSEGEWTHQGQIVFPIRACYPQVALSNHAAHVLAIGDIVEPIEEWRKFKFEKTNRKWDYVFRRLFYAYTPDLTKEDFREPLELDTVEASGGHITNLDLWVGAAGEAHILYLKTNIQALLRDRYFPGTPIIQTLEYTVVEKGKVIRRETLIAHPEGSEGLNPIYGRFQSTPDGRLWVVFSAAATSGHRVMKMMQVSPHIERTSLVDLELQGPFTQFFTAPERGGSPPSWTLDLFGIVSDPHVLRYAQLRLEPLPAEETNQGDH